VEPKHADFEDGLYMTNKIWSKRKGISRAITI